MVADDFQKEMQILVALAEVVDRMVVQEQVTVPLFLLLKVIQVVKETIMVKVVAELQEQDLDLTLLLVGQVVQVLQLQLHHLQLHTQVVEEAVMALVVPLVEQVVESKVEVIDLTQVVDLQTLEAEAEVEVVSLLQVPVVIELMVDLVALVR